MNMSLVREFKYFCVNEHIMLAPDAFKSKRQLLRTQPLLFVMFLFYAWEKTFAKTFPSTAIQIDLLNTTASEIYQQVKDIYNRNPHESMHSIALNKSLSHIVVICKMISIEAEQLRDEKRRARKAL